MADRPNELIDMVFRNLDAIRATDHRHKVDVDHLLCYSARHVSSTEFGRDLELQRVQDPNAITEQLGVDGATLDSAILTTVLASGMTALDLCASALWLWTDVDEELIYVSLAEVQKHANEQQVNFDAALQTWLDKTKGSHRYAPIKEFRDSQIHRTVRQDAAIVDVGVGSTASAVVKVGADPNRPASYSRPKFLVDVADFVLERWLAFWHLLP